MTTDQERFEEAFARLETRLGYTFKDRVVARRAFIHRSYSAEHDGEESYERLEFLGDAVLQLAVTHYLYETRPDLPEGEMAKVRAAVVNERTLAMIADELELGDVLLLGRGEEMTAGRRKASILSDVVESLLGALYLEAGFDEARAVVLRYWSDLVDERAQAPGLRDYKTRLQERLAARGRRPYYEIEEEGPEHAKSFTAKVIVGGEVLGVGHGTSKKRAEQDAARIATESLDGDD